MSYRLRGSEERLPKGKSAARKGENAGRTARSSKDAPPESAAYSSACLVVWVSGGLVT